MAKRKRKPAESAPVSKERCFGSGARVGLSMHEVLRREAICADCGRVIGVRPAGIDGGCPQATLPYHNVPVKESL